MKYEETIYIGEFQGTPIGDLWLAVSALGLVALEDNMSQAEFETWLVKRFKRSVEYQPRKVSRVVAELQEYLEGRQHHFTFVIDWTFMRPFQQTVLKATREIPYGETRTYKEIAEHIGRHRAARAVGRAEATNPMPLIIPCHRVIGSDGKLHGYGLGEGVKTKEWLLQLEGAIIA